MNTVQNGKGDKSRIGNKKIFDQNYEEINWGHNLNNAKEEDKFVILSQQEFDKLLEYSTSLPTGTTIGKKWKRRCPWNGEPHKYYLGEFVDIGDSNNVGINWKEIVIKN